MIVVVAPEPVSWLAPVARAAAAAKAGEVAVFAPWALAGPDVRLPGPIGAFARRRRVPAELGRARTLPGWPLAEGALRLWIGGRTERRLGALFAVRRAVDALAAAWVRRAGAVTAVLAPSCAAERTFAAARQRDVATYLIEDVADLRGLHQDLDLAAAAHPGCAFLRNYRAPAAVVARQRCERVLADALLVRGAWARTRRVEDGVPGERVLALPEVVVGPADVTRDGASAVLLAGPATARHGTMEALAALEARPAMRLLVRPSEGLEPAGLLAHPRVEVAAPEALRRLAGVVAVIAPAWVESHPPEVALAAASGIPIVATARAAGFTPLARCGREIPPGDAAALAAGLDEVLAPEWAPRAGATEDAAAGLGRALATRR